MAGGAPKDVWPRSDPENKSGWVPLPSLWDEFEGDAVNTMKWRPGSGNDWPGPPPLHHDLPQALEVSDNMLYCHFRRRGPQEEDLPKDYKYISGYIKSMVARRYGYFEVRLRPAYASLTSTFWLIGGSKNYSREIDIFETPSAHPQYLNKMGTNFHNRFTPKPDKVVSELHPKRPEMVKLPFQPLHAFHTYALEWDREECKFYADGELVRCVPTESWVIGMHIFAGLSWNPNFYDCVDDKKVPAKMRIQHIRTWIKPPTNDVFYVDAANGKDNNDGRSWATAFKSIQRGIDRSYDGDSIFVAVGEYVGDLTLIGIDSMKMYGGCTVGQAPDQALRDLHNNETIIRPIPKAGHNVVTLKTVQNCVIDGFTITGAHKPNSHGMSFTNGYTGTVVRRCKIAGNRPNGGVGAGVLIGSAVGGGPVKFVDCDISDNHACGKYGIGAGVFVGDRVADMCPRARFLRCTFRENVAAGSGAAVMMRGGLHEGTRVEMFGCGLFGNSFSKEGSGRGRPVVSCRSGRLVMRDCLMRRNAETGVEVVNNNADSLEMRSCRVADCGELGLLLKVRNAQPACLESSTFAHNKTHLNVGGKRFQTSTALSAVPWAQDNTLKDVDDEDEDDPRAFWNEKDDDAMDSPPRPAASGPGANQETPPSLLKTLGSIAACLGCL